MDNGPSVQEVVIYEVCALCAPCPPPAKMRTHISELTSELSFLRPLFPLCLRRLLRGAIESNYKLGNKRMQDASLGLDEE